MGFLAATQQPRGSGRFLYMEMKFDKNDHGLKRLVIENGRFKEQFMGEIRFCHSSCGFLQELSFSIH